MFVIILFNNLKINRTKKKKWSKNINHLLTKIFQVIKINKTMLSLNRNFYFSIDNVTLKC